MSQRILPHLASPLVRSLRKNTLQNQCLKFHRSTLRSNKQKSTTDSIPPGSIPKNAKLDPITIHRLRSAQRAYYKRRMVYCTIGVLFGMAGLYLTAIQAPLLPPESSNITSSSPISVNRLDSGRSDDEPIMVIGKKKNVVTQKPGDKFEDHDDFVPTGNSVVTQFPTVLSISHTASSDPDLTEYQLLGLGIRTVSFLKIQVYVVGIYIASDDVAALQKSFIKRVNPLASTLVASERDDLFTKLHDPNISEDLWDAVLKDDNCRMLIRIVPTRNTDFGHLRDAWVRTMTLRSQREGWQDETFGKSVADFKKVFARGSVPKGKEILLTRGKKGNLEVWCSGDKDREKLGELHDERVSRAIWMGYLAGKSVACEGVREGVIASLLKFVERPIGAGIGLFE
ncbi:Altered inheritance of mitochondria protein 18, mitochondrial [Golovinomyces cichoracearum]|uniref:Altered inheritance of mitochondria protein 18, mitochondrial n=1 Tax=Golovinomyces cichoracearum TaxID=62708 RepID=A0A420HUW8_9PEZI|nr:Altered inheritance of mitochondria protein 18, mitochondrial [Golovinomyces cichoracearum]